MQAQIRECTFQPKVDSFVPSQSHYSGYRSGEDEERFGEGQPNLPYYTEIKAMRDIDDQAKYMNTLPSPTQSYLDKMEQKSFLSEQGEHSNGKVPLKAQYDCQYDSFRISEDNVERTSQDETRQNQTPSDFKNLLENQEDSDKFSLKKDPRKVPSVENPIQDLQPGSVNLSSQANTFLTLETLK